MGRVSCDGLAPSQARTPASYLVNAGIDANIHCEPDYKCCMDLLKLIITQFKGLHATIRGGRFPD